MKNVSVLQKSPLSFFFKKASLLQVKTSGKPIETQEIISYVVVLAFSSLATSGIIGFLVLCNGRLKNGEVSNVKKAWHLYFQRAISFHR